MSELMPTGIAKAIAKIMKEITPAKRTGEATENGETYTYASADDVFAALGKAMGGAGLLFEFLDASGAEPVITIGDKIGFHLRLVPCWTLVSKVAIDDEEEDEAGKVVVTKAEAEATERFINNAGVVHAVALIEGNNSVTATRTTAEKAYLRNYFKLSSEAAPGQATGDGEENRAPSAAGIGRAPGRDPAPKVGRQPRAIAHPYALSPEESGVECARIVGLIEAAQMPDTVQNIFRENMVKYGKLQAADQAKVKRAMEERAEALGIPA